MSFAQSLTSTFADRASTSFFTKETEMALIIEESRTLAANEIVENLLEGRLGQILTRGSRVIMAYIVDVGGGIITVTLGDQLSTNAANIPVKAGSISTRDDIRIEAFGVRGTPIIMRVVNGAAIAVLQFYVNIDAVPGSEA